MLIKPFIATVDASGHATVTIRHDIHGLQWKIYQIGFALGQNAPLAQLAANVNGVPLTSTVVMQQSVFSQLSAQPPYAMESFFVGPPYIPLMAGDQLTIGLINGKAGDIFTAAAYIEELDATEPAYMGA